MALYREALPQLSDRLFLSDSGLETTRIFHEGYELPLFAAIGLMADEAGRQRLDRYYREHAAIAAEAHTGLILESATWRASADWGALLHYLPEKLASLNRAMIAMLVDVRADFPEKSRPIVISGCIGPRGDGYDGSASMSAEEAQSYHAVQIRTFAETEADMVHAMTMTYPEEAIGILRAARQAEIPCAISFTVETDGVLPDGTALGAAIRRVEEETDGSAAYYGINCAHPTHFEQVLDPTSDWVKRLREARANASRQSHAELDEAEVLDAGNATELAQEYVQLCATVPSFTVLGGCCGTDLSHLRAIASSLA